MIFRRLLAGLVALALLASTPAAAFLTVTNLTGFSVGAAQPIVLTHLGSNSSTVDGTSFNFGNFTAATSGLMIVATSANGGGSNAVLSSASIGGTNGTVHIAPSGSSFGSGIASRQVSAGANNVTVVYSTSRGGAAVDVWLLTGNISDTPTDTDGVNTATNGTSSPATLDIPANGVAVYTELHENTGAVTWSGATERQDVTVDSQQHSAADKSSAVAIPGDVVTPSWAGSVDRGMSAAAWN